VKERQAECDMKNREVRVSEIRRLRISVHWSTLVTAVCSYDFRTSMKL